MTGRRTRGLASSATAFSAVALMLDIAESAGVKSATALVLVVMGGTAITLAILGAVLMRLLARGMPNEWETRLVMEVMGMMIVAAPVCLVVGLSMRWVG